MRQRPLVKKTLKPRTLGRRKTDGPPLMESLSKIAVNLVGITSAILAALLYWQAGQKSNDPAVENTATMKRIETSREIDKRNEELKDLNSKLDVLLRQQKVKP